MPSDSEFARAGWARIVYTQLANHIIDTTQPLVPEGASLLVAGSVLALVEPRPVGGLRSVAEIGLLFPTEPLPPQALAVQASYLLSDVQELVGEWLHAAWPLNDAGVALHPDSQLDGEQVTMRFTGQGINADTAPIPLAPFFLPREFDARSIRIIS
jgi:hypothetical protein